MTNVWLANNPMSLANIIMTGIGFVALLLGVGILLRRGGSDSAIVARRIVGTMILALGLVLSIFAFGLRGVQS